MSDHLRERWGRQVVGVAVPDLPDKGMFTRGNSHLDPRVFTPDEKLRPDLRSAIIETLDGYWGPLYGNWQRWAMVYVAGSAASYWWDSDTDLDILIGVDMAELRRQRPQNIGVSEEDVCAHLDAGLKTDLDPQTTDFLGTGMTATFFCNPGSYDIERIKPYAAYNVTTDTWAVHPPVLPDDWGARYFPMDWWERAATIAARITEILEEPEPERTELGVSLFDAMHAQRNKAYSPLGFGWTDWGNFNWQVQSQWHTLQPLYRLKHPELAPTTAANMSFAREGAGDWMDRLLDGLTDAQRDALLVAMKGGQYDEEWRIPGQGYGVRLNTVKKLHDMGLCDEPVMGYSRTQGGDTWGWVTLTPKGVRVALRLKRRVGRW